MFTKVHVHSDGALDVKVTNNTVDNGDYRDMSGDDESRSTHTSGGSSEYYDDDGRDITPSYARGIGNRRHDDKARNELVARGKPRYKRPFTTGSKLDAGDSYSSVPFQRMNKRAESRVRLFYFVSFHLASNNYIRNKTLMMYKAIALSHVFHFQCSVLNSVFEGKDCQ